MAATVARFQGLEAVEARREGSVSAAVRACAVVEEDRVAPRVLEAAAVEASVVAVEEGDAEVEAAVEAGEAGADEIEPR